MNQYDIHGKVRVLSALYREIGTATMFDARVSARAGACTLASGAQTP
jgi:hypothetical protein